MVDFLYPSCTVLKLLHMVVFYAPWVTFYLAQWLSNCKWWIFCTHLAQCWSHSNWLIFYTPWLTIYLAHWWSYCKWLIVYTPLRTFILLSDADIVNGWFFIQHGWFIILNLMQCYNTVQDKKSPMVHKTQPYAITSALCKMGIKNQPFTIAMDRNGH